MTPGRADAVVTLSGALTPDQKTLVCLSVCLSIVFRGREPNPYQWFPSIVLLSQVRKECYTAFWKGGDRHMDLVGMGQGRAGQGRMGLGVA